MSRRLQPLRSQRRVRFRITLPTLVLPLLAMVLLARVEVLRAPLGEREATLAIAAQPTRGHLSEMPAGERTGARTPAAIAAARLAPRILSSAESHLRLPGVVAGAAAIGLAVLLGERLFATRVGLAAALLLLLLPASRPMLGTQLGAEPLFLLAMLAALAAIRDMADSRRSAIVAGAATGIAIALGGSDGAWLVLLALVWLASIQGLSVRSATAVIGSALVSLCLATALAQLALGRWASPASILPAQILSPQLMRSLGPRGELVWSLAPIAGLGLLGILRLPPRWWRNPSLRFVAAWLVLGACNALAGGSPIPAYVAAVFLVAMLGVWGVERAPRVAAIAAIAATIGLAVVGVRAPQTARGERSLDRWAVREAGEFLWRTVPADRRIAGGAGAQQRLTYYARRPIEPLDLESLAGVDYLVLPRKDFSDAQRRVRQVVEPGERRSARLRMVAEFGPWVIARVVRSDEPRAGVGTLLEGDSWSSIRTFDRDESSDKSASYVPRRS